MKKFLALTLSLAMALSLAACGAKPSDGGKDEDKDGYTVAIIKQMDHASLDEIADAIAARLDAIAQEQNVSIRYTITSGQGDQSVLKQLADQAVADQVDAIIPIATTAAQVSAVAAEDSRTPVVYAAISDPDTAKLTGIDYVTGTSDALNTEYILDMMLAQDPGVSKVGLLYSLSEPNSTKPIAEAKAYLEQHGITCVEQTANTNDEVVAAAAALISVIRALTVSPDSEFVAIAPYFPEYRVFIEGVKGKIKVIPPELEHFQIDFSAFEQAVTCRTKGVIINSPNNPSGVVYSPDTLQAVAALLRRKAALDKWTADYLDSSGGEPLEVILSRYTQEKTELAFRLRTQTENKAKVSGLQEELNVRRTESERWAKLNELAGSADGAKFRRIAQGYTLDILLNYANVQLRELTRRYRLERVPETLALQVIDRDMCDEVRTVHSLSGGESFLVSLALALGLSSLSSNRMRVESLFIDEGFGSLDAETLRVAMDALESLRTQGRKIGVISHVQEMTERIPVRVQVSRVGNGKSVVRIEN